MTNDQIQSAPCPKCILCGNDGAPLHSNIQDRIFDAPGSWNVKICTNDKCGLLWLDPMPLSTEIGKAYRNYYTHSTTNSGQDSAPKRIYLQAKRRWLNRVYKYPEKSSDKPIGLLTKACAFLPVVRRMAKRDVRFLPFVSGGKLLDVGCGSAAWLVQMKELGWSVEGLDFDPKAVQAASDRGVHVSLGSLEEQAYPTASFDAITLSHVIEHVPDPLGTIKECARLLKPNGTLVLFTPNASSLSHRYFKQDWRGLEPPRHLHIFSLQSIRLLFSSEEFTSVSGGPDVGTSASFESVFIRKSRQKNTKIAVTKNWRKTPHWRLLSWLQHLTAWMIPSIAECQVVVAIKK